MELCKMRVNSMIASIIVAVSVMSAAVSVSVDTKGQEFLLALMEQVTQGETKVQINSDVTTHVTIEAPFTGLSKTYNVQPGSTLIKLDPSLRGISTELSFKGIHIKSDDPIGVFVIDDVTEPMGGYVALPITALAKQYMISSFNPKMKSQFVITSVGDRTKVSIYLKTKGNTTYYGMTYKDGDTFHETIDKFQTWQIQSDQDLTGTIIKAEGKVAVFSGSMCAQLPGNNTSCDYIVEQMPTTTAWDRTFVVPLMSDLENVVRVLGLDDSTLVKITLNSDDETLNLNTSHHIDKHIRAGAASVVTIVASRPVLVTLLTAKSYSSAGVNFIGGPSMTTVPGLIQFDSYYRFEVSSDLDRVTLEVIMPTEELSGIRLNNDTVTIKHVKRTNVVSAHTHYTVFEVTIPDGVTDIVLEHIDGKTFGAVIYGARLNGSFSLPLGMQLDLSPANELIRLVNGSSTTSGRVEISYHGNWGTICSDTFSYTEATVVCRMLGFFYGAANPVIYTNGHYGQGKGAAYVNKLKCDGTEMDVSQCKSDHWSYSACPHSRDIGIDCGSRIRLNGFDDPREGRLELFYKHQWGTVCDDNFGRKAAQVVCRSLGYGNVGYVYTGGQGTGPRWMDDLQCTGDENDIAECMVKPWGVSDCSHDEDVWVACYEHTPLRLSGGATPAEGKVEVLVERKWSTVCDTDFSVNDADVVCKMLGYKRDKTSVTVFRDGRFGARNGFMSISELRCRGDETDIAECLSNPWLITNCSHGHDVSVRCGSSIRLVNGPRPSAGRLEVYYKGHWGSVCEDGFGTQEAGVVCRVLGYPDGVGLNPVKYNATYGTGSGRIVIDDIDCDGNETDFALCRSSPWLNSTNCIHSDDVGVDCGTSIRLVNGSSPTEGRVEVFYQGTWGTVCDDNFDINDANTICDQLGYKYDVPRKLHESWYYGEGTGPITIDELDCTGRETDIQFCLSSPWLTTDCSHHEDVGIDCGIRLQDVITSNCSPFGWDIQVNMRSLKRLYPRSVESDIVLRTAGTTGCKGRHTGDTLVFDRSLQSCDTKATVFSDKTVYTNELVYIDHDQFHPSIINDNWSVVLNCDIMTNGSVQINSVFSSINNTLGDVSDQSDATYRVIQTVYSDPGYTHALSNNPFQLKGYQSAYVKIYSPDADSDTKVVLQSCHAAPSNTPQDSRKISLITNGCETDTSIHLTSLGYHESRFSFMTSSVTTSQQGIFVHCDIKFCHVTDSSRNCQPVCYN